MIEKPIAFASSQPTAILIGLINQQQDEKKLKEFLDELAFLAETAGIRTVKKYSQRLASPDNRTFIGSGKLGEIKDFVHQNDVNMIIFDDDLSPAQLKNIEKELNKGAEVSKFSVIDRSYLILEIFAQRARSAHAKTQVQLAQYEYLLPRLTGMWTHLERQRGGTGTRGGSGEKEIETDRRIVKSKISKLKEELKLVDRQKATQRSNRGSLVRAALVGYTNVGKSTVMNLISKSNVFAENKLFATLDTTVRKVVIENLPFLLSDTVGFIRKLPHQLVESFKSTLDEVRESDLLIHVVDVSHPNFEEQIQVVNQTLMELGAKDKPTIILFNKMDLYHPGVNRDEFDLTGNSIHAFSLEDLKKTWIAKTGNGSNYPENNAESKLPVTLFISATEKSNIEEFRKTLYEQVKNIHIKRYPYHHFLY